MVVVEQVVQQVDTTIINNNNNGMDLIMAPVVIRGVVIIQPAVVMIVSNNKLEPVMAITVNKIRVGGIIRHEMNMKIQLATSLLVTRNLIHQMIRYTHDAWFFSDKQTVFFFCSLSDCSMLCSFHFICIRLSELALIYSFFLSLSTAQVIGTSIDYKLIFFRFFLFISMFLSCCHCLFSSPPHIFCPFFIQYVCVRVFKTMILSIPRSCVFRQHRSRKKVSS